jgi:hypothetical protein
MDLKEERMKVFGTIIIQRKWKVRRKYSIIIIS